jgi:Dolichyl-phosphate-mannose-protein mannosyltransferase
MALPQLAETSAADRGRSERAAFAQPASPLVLVLVAGLIAVGVVLRIIVARQSLFADELSTYWIVTTHGLHGVLSLIYGTASIKHAEITPPLYFVASWVTTQLGHTPQLLRLPSLVAGTLTIPVVYLLGLRTVGRRAALAAAAFTAVSPFMVYYSTEARAYGVMMFLVVGSTLALLLGVDTGRRRWWALYALCACLAFWTHTTCAFVLAAQLIWVLWAHPEARRAALVASGVAALAVIPWLPGLVNQLQSPTLKILSLLSTFTPSAVVAILSHWAVGYPYDALAHLSQIPGVAGLVLLSVAGGLTAVALGLRSRTMTLRAGAVRRQDRFLLVVGLLLVTPLAEGVVSLFATHIFGLRNLAASWPELALLFGLLVMSAGEHTGYVAAGLAVVGLGLGSYQMARGRFGRPDYQAAAAFAQRTARPGDVVLDETGDLSPGPLTALDVALTRRLPIVRALAPDEREHPFTLRDPYVSLSAATAQAIAATRSGGRVLVVGGIPSALTLAANARLAGGPAAVYRRTAVRRYTNISVAVYARSGQTTG